MSDPTYWTLVTATFSDDGKGSKRSFAHGIFRDEKDRVSHEQDMRADALDSDEGDEPLDAKHADVRATRRRSTDALALRADLAHRLLDVSSTRARTPRTTSNGVRGGEQMPDGVVAAVPGSSTAVAPKESGPSQAALTQMKDDDVNSSDRDQANARIANPQELLKQLQEMKAHGKIYPGSPTDKVMKQLQAEVDNPS
jgi:hypothetical protein